MNMISPRLLPTEPAVPPVLVIIGPSACGKSSIVRLLDRRGVIRVHPTWTTRPRRSDELLGSVEHRFVTDRVFEQLSDQGFFLATGVIDGLPHRYGLAPLPTPAARRYDAVVLRSSYVEDLARAVGPERPLLVYQVADSARRAGQRLAERGGNGEELAARLADHDREVAEGRRIADRVFINDRPIPALASAVATMLRLDLTVLGAGEARGAGARGRRTA